MTSMSNALGGWWWILSEWSSPLPPPSLLLRSPLPPLLLRTIHTHLPLILTHPTLREARIEFGAAFAAKLKTTPDGHTILWPQPHDTPEDPQNWSARRKALQLFIVTLAAIVPDFDSGIGMCAFRWGGGRGPGT